MQPIITSQIRSYSFLFIMVLFCSFKADPVTENEVYCYIKSIGIKNPEVVLRQAIYESGHFNSSIFRNKNNVFGFRRTMTYITYKDWKACVDYYKVWQDKHYKDTTQDYYTFLQKINYSGHSNFNYAKELKGVKIRGTLTCK
jgi:uncharacterized FlgJ-related protein